MRKNKIVPSKEVDMTSIADSSVIIQTSSESVPATPSWFGEVALIIPYLRKQGVLSAISSQVRLVRRRFGHYEVIDFLAVLFGYEILGERTLEEFYEQLLPLAQPFMALFDRERLPSRSALSRFLASLTWEATEALRTLFLADLLTRPLDKERHTGQLVDRAGNARVVFDIDGTRQAARQRALPVTEELPSPQRRLNQVCAPGYTGRKRGEVVRTRTVVSQAHSYHWLGSFSNSGNGRYREELRRALTAIRGYLEAHHLSPISALVRLDGQYGTGTVITDLAGFSFVMRGKDYTVLDRESVQSRLHLPADQQFSRPESELVRSLYDCPDVAVGPDGQRCRVVVATHPANAQKSRVGLTRSGLVYELFFTHLPQDAFTASDVVALYLHRGAFEPVLADEDQEQDPDRWCSHAPAGQEAWQIVSQWVWNLRLELGHVLEPTPMRTTEFAPSVKEPTAEQAPVQGYGKPSVALPWKAGRFSGQDFAPQPDGALSCPAGKTLRPTEQQSFADGSLRVLYSARILDCRGCPKRLQCQWHGEATTKPRRISVLLHPLRVGPAPLLWRDWSRREHRRACMQLVRHQRIEVSLPPAAAASPRKAEVILSRAQRAHSRLSWAERFARNARVPTASQVTIRLFGVPEGFAISLGLATA
jgi:hypothetical protein